MLKCARWDLIKPFVKDKKVLNMGICGSDPSNYDSPFWLHKYIDQESSYCLGLDISKEGINLLKKEEYNVICANAEDFDLNDEFDVIVAGELIEHLANFDGFHNSVKKHLKPGGVFIISTPNVFCYRFPLRLLAAKCTGRSSDVFNREHTCWFNEQTIKQLLSRFNFEVFDVKYVNEVFHYKYVPRDKYVLSKILPLPKNLKYPTMVVFCKLKT